MRKFIATLLVVLTALAVPSVALAQSSASTSAAADGNSSGVITAIQVDEDTRLVGFLLSTKYGLLVEVSVGDATKFGLENASGDRWVADLGEDPDEALRRMTDQRERFAPVTVTVTNGVASAVVDRDQGDLERNLGYLFAIYLVTWAGFFAYIFIMSRKQGDLAREINALKAKIQ
jgi:CcmD family protein